MNFTVKYRSAEGGLKTEVVSAANRAEVFAQMKARGVTPTSVVEGGKLAELSSRAAPPSWLKGALAGVFVVVAAVVAWLLLAPAEKPAAKPAPAPKKPKLIHTNVVRKAEAPKPVETNAVVEAAPAPVDPDARPTKVGEELNGFIKLPSGRLHKVRGVVTNNVSQAVKGWYSVFPHHCDNEIACYLAIKPGTPLLGDRKYNGRFKEEFIRSLSEPIIVNEDDSDEVKALKRNVAEAKANLKEALDRGEDIEQIMADTRKELQDLGRYKMDIERHVRELHREGNLTVDGLQDVVDAANKMLAAKGIAPMKFGPLVRQKMLMMREEAKKQESK